MDQPNYNKLIAAALSEMARQPGKNAYQKKNYNAAAKAISLHPTQILSGAQAKREIGKGIGDSIMDKIDEVVKTGTLQVLEMRPQEEKDKEKIIALFDSIHEVGKVTATKWYNMGARTFQDLARIYQSMTHEQQMGYTFYNDFRMKVPRAEIDWVDKFLHSILDPIGIVFVIAGSYRRGLPESGDIDMLVENPSNLTLDKVLIAIRQSGLIVAYLAGGGIDDVDYRGVIKTPQNLFYPNPPARRFDIKLINKDRWSFALLHFTGSWEFNEHLRRITKSMGFKLNQYGLFDHAEKRYDAKSEQEIFDLIGVQYIPPHERNNIVQLVLKPALVQQLQIRPVFTDLRLQQTTQQTNPQQTYVGKWYNVNSTVLMYNTDNMIYTTQIAAFDLDGTIINSKSGEFPKGVDDVVIMPRRREILQGLINQGYTIVIITNQLSRSEKEKEYKYNRMRYALYLLNLPVILFMSTGNDMFRKPESGIWPIVQYYLPKITTSLFVGNAAGREHDHSDSDMIFAKNAGISFYIPEQVFV